MFLYLLLICLFSFDGYGCVMCYLNFWRNMKWCLHFFYFFYHLWNEMFWFIFGGMEIVAESAFFKFCFCFFFPPLLVQLVMFDEIVEFRWQRESFLWLALPCHLRMSDNYLPILGNLLTPTRNFPFASMKRPTAYILWPSDGVEELKANHPRRKTCFP